jgi:hypothetical protein
VAHPYRLFQCHSLEEDAIFQDPQPRLAVFTDTGGLDFASQLLREQLVAVADTQDREPQLEDPRIRSGRSLLIYARGATRKNESGSATAFDLPGRDIIGYDLRIYLTLPHPAGDKLGVLRPEIYHQHTFL